LRGLGIQFTEAEADLQKIGKMLKLSTALILWQEGWVNLKAQLEKIQVGLLMKIVNL